jgi:hypothetical protein
MKKEKVIPMGGWKMKTSAFLAAIGTGLIGLAQAVPNPKVAPWMSFVGIALDGLAGAFGIWGAGHKLEKNKTVVMVDEKNRMIEPPSESNIE